MTQTFSNSSFRMLLSEIEGMILKVIGLLFFALAFSLPVVAEDYQVLSGDSASSISQKEKISNQVLQRANPSQDWEQLKAGDRLTIPERYLVKAGDTLYSLCRLWGVDQADFLVFNGLSAPVVLKVGQTLFLPPATSKNSETTAYWPVAKVPHPAGDKLRSVTFATAGEPFRSVCQGTVVYQGEFRGVGRVLLVQASDKAIFGYGNFQTSSVNFGQSVAKGQVLGVTSPRPSQKLTFFSFRQNQPLDVFSAKR